MPEQHGQIFESVLSRCGLTPERIVLELTDDGLADPAPLAAAIAGYKARGYRIAIDNFGRHSNDLDRLAVLGPDIVKLDRCLSGRVQPSSQVARTTAQLIAELHRRGIQVAAQHVETVEHAQQAKALGVDWLQGFLSGVPTPDCKSIARMGQAATSSRTKSDRIPVAA
ncbi:EAL domain-containing protein [Thauera sp. SDU_THAU2]|uniref:EAL domain-containing protein n=1 Tax=Thauera sp. SDU_THAU2 TaxID=3136633 RepID=UPI0031204881